MYEGNNNGNKCENLYIKKSSRGAIEPTVPYGENHKKDYKYRYNTLYNTYLKSFPE